KKEDCYMPVNYEGGYRGPISMRSSLAQSRNVTSVKTLYLAGIDDTIATAHKMGVTSLNDRSRYGLSLVLGGGEVSLLDMTSAYSVFANDGVRNPSTAILRVEDNKGNVLEEFKNNDSQVIPSEIAREITSILSDNVARTPTFGPNSALYFPNNDVAVKTGTTNDYRDVWTVGYTPNITVGMWAGNNDNSSITKGNSAAATVSLVWHAFMEEALKATPPEKFIAPEKEDLTALPAPLQGIWQGGEKYVIDRTSGKLATPLTPIETRETIVVPDVHTILHWVNKDDPRGAPPVNPQNDPQYNLWEIPVRDWVAKQNIKEGDRGVIPTDYDTNHTVASIPVVSMTGVDFTAVHKSTENLTVSVSATTLYPVDHVDLFVNNELITTKKVAPYTFSFNLNDVTSLSINNTITAVVYDSIFDKGTSTQQLLIE
ncbi:MAG: penicillin-binding transpeptidase domain-containing protein, partial [Bacteroidota bacterium]|nr:penicillin-binding transpeptidase domain-containing protein [Bacteroidota bacterium]